MQRAISVNRNSSGSEFEVGELQDLLAAGFTVNQTATAGDKSVIFVLDPPEPKKSEQES
jgi:hypothetical protein